MYNNVGKKIKGLAVFVCFVGILASFGLGVSVIASSENVVLGVLIICIGVVLSWVGCFFMYGFGELIDKVSVDITKILSTIQTNTHTTVMYEQLQYEYMKVKDNKGN